MHPAANAWDDRLLHTLWMAAERYTHLVFDPTRISADERDRRYETHPLLRDAALVEDAEAMAEALREHLCVNEDRIRDHIRAIEPR